LTAALNPEDKEKIHKEINDAFAWIRDNKNAEVSVYEAKRKELEDKLMPLMQAGFQAAPFGYAGGIGLVPYPGIGVCCGHGGPPVEEND
jgi:hypothetical protein